MAKLSANGRTEILSATKQILPEPDPLEDEGVIGRRNEWRLMSDGTVLRNHYWTRINPFTERPQTENTGWRVYGRLKKGYPIEAYAQKLSDRLRAKGYTVEMTPPAVRHELSS